MVRQRYIGTQGVGDRKFCFLEIQTNDIGTPATGVFFFSDGNLRGSSHSGDRHPSDMRSEKAVLGFGVKRAGFIGGHFARDMQLMPGLVFS